MQLGQSQRYQNAQRALVTLKTNLGLTAEVRAIAEFMLYAAESEVPERLFPYVGQPLDPRDQAVVDAFRGEYQRLASGDDEDYSTVID